MLLCSILLCLLEVGVGVFLFPFFLLLAVSDVSLECVLVHNLYFEKQKLDCSVLNHYEFKTNNILFHCYCR